MARLLWRNLLYHWRGNLAVLLGVAVASTVLTGALLVGDSLRGSLRARTLQRLGWVDQSLVAPRFFRQALARQLREAGAAARVEPAILLRATASGPPAGGTRTRARGVTVLGVEDSFLPLREAGQPAEVVWLNGALAEALNVRAGDTVTLHLQKPGELPRESALGKKKVEFEELELRVGRVLAGEEFGNLFDLRPELEAPRNAFVPLALLQERLGQQGHVNALLAQGGTDLRGQLRSRLRLEDWGLVLRGPKERADQLFTRSRKPSLPGVIAKGIKRRGPDVLTRSAVEAFFRRRYPYLSLESKQLLLDRPAESAALEAADPAGLGSAPTLVYLCRLRVGGRRIAGVVGALDPTRPAPLGPFLPPGRKGLADDEIVLADWGWGEKRPKVGDEITLTYKPAEHHGPAPDRTARFRLAGYFPLSGAAADPGITPVFPGITDKENVRQWELPFEDPNWDQETLRTEYEEKYWDEYRATPKAYVPLPAGRRLWASRFGALTSIRLAPKSGGDLDSAKERFERELLTRLDPEKGGLAFAEVKRDALEASRGGGFDFSRLFLGFSSFLIASALLLVGLLFRLNLDRRASEVGLLFAEGYRRGTVRWLLLGEGAALALVGSLAGAALGIAYSRLLVRLLGALWPGGTLTSFLRPDYTYPSLALGAGAALVVSVLTIAWVVRGLSKVPPRALLAGQTTGEGEPGLPRPARWSGWVAGVCLVLGAALLIAGAFVKGHEARAGTFFGGGALLLTAALAGVSLWMRRSHRRPVEGGGWWGVGRLGVRNGARHPARSLLTAGLLASAAFLIVAVESFRRKAEAGTGGVHSPSGGFALLAESDLPVVRDLNSPAGRAEVLEGLRAHLLNAGQAPAEAKKEVDEARALLEGTTVFAFRVRAGDDVSCLNLYQPRTPRLLGVPRPLIDRGGFTFAGTEARTPDEKNNPWLVLLREAGRGDEPVPVFGEKNTVQWMLKTDLGGTLTVPAGDGAGRAVPVAGLLQDSVFQSSLLMSEENFLKLYPDTEGYNFFLIQPPPGKEAEVKRLLERALAERGFEVTSTARRLESYLAVENTYLTTFQALGGLGLILGSLGLAVVLLRGVWERRAELALLRALGYRRATLGWLVLAENGFLLLLGLGAGASAALLSVAPHLAGGGGSVPWADLALLLGLVLGVGLAAGSVAVAATLRAPLVPALRRE
jgi:putative ABC transport system permease protein